METQRQALVIKKNKERHTLDLQAKQELRRQRLERIAQERMKNVKTAEERKLNIQKQREFHYKSNRDAVQNTQEETNKLKEMSKKNEKLELNQKIQQKIEIENKKMLAKRARQENIIQRLNLVKVNHHKDAQYEKELASMASSRVGTIEEEERRLLERLQSMEIRQQRAIEELKGAISSNTL